MCVSVYVCVYVCTRVCMCKCVCACARARVCSLRFLWKIGHPCIIFLLVYFNLSLDCSFSRSYSLPSSQPLPIILRICFSLCLHLAPSPHTFFSRRAIRRLSCRTFRHTNTCKWYLFHFQNMYCIRVNIHLDSCICCWCIPYPASSAASAGLYCYHFKSVDSVLLLPLPSSYRFGCVWFRDSQTFCRVDARALPRGAADG